MNELLEKGVRRLEWAKDHMPVLADIRKRMVDEQALKGLKIGMALHVEAKTGMLALTLQKQGLKLDLPAAILCPQTIRYQLLSEIIST